jgi:3-oxoacyl-[acyl-carrier protein] reductase
MDLAGGTAIVTGAGGGLGRALAEGFAHAGAGVVIADVDAQAAHGTALLVRARGVPAPTVVGDVRRPADAARIISAAASAEPAESVGGSLVLVNNAGGWSPAAQYPEAPPAEWTSTLELNLHAPMLLTQLVLPAMRRQGGGAVINIASSAALGDAAYGSPEYGAAKAGLIRFTTASRSLEVTHGVRVMCIVPDWIGLDRAIAERNGLSPEERAELPPLIPPADVVDVALSLARSGHAGAVVELRGGEPPIARS